MEYTKLIKIVGIILISILFVYAGINKILNFNDTVQYFNKKVNFIDINLSKVIIVMAILILLISPILILIGMAKNNSLLLQIGTGALIVFTILATIIFHPITDANERNNMLKNISIIGGLALVLVI
jgi:putative oxidoreductase